MTAPPDNLPMWTASGTHSSGGRKVGPPLAQFLGAFITQLQALSFGGSKRKFHVKQIKAISLQL